MKILILGGAGVIGRKLTDHLARQGTLRGQAITDMVLADITAADAPPDAPFATDSRVCDISDRASVDAAIDPDTDVVFLLAAIVSAHAEEDFGAGIATNLMGVINVLERCRALATNPVVVFTSSIAVFGGEVPDPITDHTFLNPQTSYGAQKAMGELLLNDYSRRGFVDGRGFRLPTISVRPGAPNRAASSFMSSIIREPLSGQEAVCPVAADFPHYYLSPRRCVENLALGADLPADALGQNRCMTMPGKTWTIGQLVQAMTDEAGPEPARLIRWEDQPGIKQIVSGWRYAFEPKKALALGLRADDSFRDNVRYFIEDDLSA